MEAENYTGRLPGQGAAAGLSWTSTTTPTGYVGAGAMQTANSGVTTLLDENGPALLYTAQFTTTGTYYVYLRGRSADSYSDSIHAGLNRAPASAASWGFGLVGYSAATYEWRSLVQGNGKTLSTTVTVPTPGLYTFYRWMREDGLIVDRIWLSTSPTASAEANTGHGPTASAPTTAR